MNHQRVRLGLDKGCKHGSEIRQVFFVTPVQSFLLVTSYGKRSIGIRLARNVIIEIINTRFEKSFFDCSLVLTLGTHGQIKYIYSLPIMQLWHIGQQIQKSLIKH